MSLLSLKNILLKILRSSPIQGAATRKKQHSGGLNINKISIARRISPRAVVLEKCPLPKDVVYF